MKNRIITSLMYPPSRSNNISQCSSGEVMLSSNYYYITSLNTGPKKIEVPLAIKPNEAPLVSSKKIAFLLRDPQPQWAYPEVVRYRKNYKKLFEHYFLSSGIFRYTIDDGKYYIGSGIIFDDKFNIIVLLTREYPDINYIISPELLVEATSLYINSQLVLSPANKFEKAIFTHIYKNLIDINISKTVVTNSINAMFLKHNKAAFSKEKLSSYLKRLSSRIPDIINNL